jgi:hypothetical protein
VSVWRIGHPSVDDGYPAIVGLPYHALSGVHKHSPRPASYEIPSHLQRMKVEAPLGTAFTVLALAECVVSRRARLDAQCVPPRAATARMTTELI